MTSDTLTRYIATNKSTAEIASLAGLTLADLRPLDTALPGDDVRLPAHVEAALAPVLGRQVKIGKGKRTAPLVGKRGSGAPIQEGRISAMIVQALAGGRRRTVPALIQRLYGEETATLRETVGKALRRLEGHGLAKELDEHPEVNTRWRVKRWALTAAGEEAGKRLQAEKS